MHVLAETAVATMRPSLSPEQLRCLYRQKSESSRKCATRSGLWIAVAVYLAYSFTDYLFISDVVQYTIAGRLAVGVGALCILEFLLYRNAKADTVDMVAAASVLAAYLVWLLTAQMTTVKDAFSYYMVFGAIFMMSVNLFFSFRFPVALAASATNMLIFIVALYLFAPMLLLHKLILGAFCISCFIFTSYVNLQLNRERYKVFLNALEASLQQAAADERGKALLQLSNTDSLTGLENRRAIDQRLRDYWERWQDHRVPFAVLLIDVDYFKHYNDCYGHQEGDRCLVAVSHLLQSVASSFGSIIGRYGGEEFIVIAPMQDSERATELAEAMCVGVRALAWPHEHRRDGTSVITVSVGVSYTRDQTKQVDKVIHEADRALYAAKATGRDTLVVFDPEDPQSNDDSEDIAATLKIALEHGLVSLVYQPIRNVQTGKTDAVEALMRLAMLDGTPVSPGKFIPVAERTGSIIELGRWAIRTVCRDLLATDLVQVVSVNVSPIELKVPGFAGYVAATLAEFDVTGARLAFEITEGVELEIDKDVVRCISDLRKLGAQVWLDDFGTGFAGLSWLRLIEFDTVKIDRSFLHDCNTERGKRMLLDIITLLRNRGVKILVEGVETIEHQRLMQQYGISQLQGYYIGRPAPASQLEADNVLRFSTIRNPDSRRLFRNGL
ncbi:GGDEF and EAL domain-containing protein [Neorhizobium galegae]|uniref:putative bifunctional diguanylate cyclase/phosphodiesterase n=1 Tax=Neorhizobium galegae TaxID=399 RepID=UPI00062151E9|nr:GGDEF and EAL domain-containing protein [Neorhizobium galegae]MCQ1775729.1 GGDEF and EAL domain-containing protein [Neorhizobium galegae]MCQ1797141.1 GGDEF and EAL domain-containing protein [Neorhizobium galegae]CDZ30737.1 Ggdef domain/eal domain protein [Neorhizobium galegae bv. officinalis]